MPSKTIQERYEAWRALNPHIMELFVKFALQAWNGGRRTYGIKAIAERVRWFVNVEQNATEEFKICNDFTSRIARDLHAHPTHGDKFSQMFVLRALRRE